MSEVQLLLVPLQLREVGERQADASLFADVESRGAHLHRHPFARSVHQLDLHQVADLGPAVLGGERGVIALRDERREPHSDDPRKRS